MRLILQTLWGSYRSHPPVAGAGACMQVGMCTAQRHPQVLTSLVNTLMQVQVYACTAHRNPLLQLFSQPANLDTHYLP